MNNQVARVYSEAFFDLSKEKSNLDLHKDQLGQIGQVLDENKEISSIINNPNISREEKKNFLKDLFGTFDKDLVNLLNVLVDKSRFEIINDLIRDFNKKYNAENNIMEGIVYSSTKLEEGDLKDLIGALEKKYDKKVALENVEDPSLIGGVSILIDGQRIDNSIKSRLENLKNRLMKEGE